MERKQAYITTAGAGGQWFALLNHHRIDPLVVLAGLDVGEHLPERAARDALLPATWQGSFAKVLAGRPSVERHTR